MAFVDEFLSRFTLEEQQSEIVQIFATIGSNMEAAAAQELTSIVNQSVDYSAAPIDRIRSILSFFYVPVRNFTASSGLATIQITSATGTVTISAGELITAEGGVTFEQQADVFLNPGESTSFEVIQGEIETSTGVYSEFIAIPAVGVELSTIEVELNAVTVPRLEDANTVTPVNGFFASYYEGTLYIKIFPGDDVPAPANQTYNVSYRTCEGFQGNTGQNTLQSYVNQIIDSNGEPVEYTLSNDSISTGQNAPPDFEIVNLLRFWFFVKGTVASTPEYLLFFTSQPEVGDAQVEGDYDRFVRTGQVEITGRTNAILMDKQGQNLDANTRAIIEARLAPLRDIGFTLYDEFQTILHRYTVRYQSATDIALFNQTTETTIRNFYNLTFVRSRGDSLFQDLDTNQILANLRFDLRPVGVELVVEHYRETAVTAGQTLLEIVSYEGEEPGAGRYEYVYEDGGNDVTVNFREFVQESGVINILDPTNDVVGTHDRTTLQVIFSYTFATAGVVRSYWPLDNPKNAVVGASDGARALQEVVFELY